MGNGELVYSPPFVSYERGSVTRSQSRLRVPEPQNSCKDCYSNSPSGLYSLSQVNDVYIKA